MAWESWCADPSPQATHSCLRMVPGCSHSDTTSQPRAPPCVPQPLPFSAGGPQTLRLSPSPHLPPPTRWQGKNVSGPNQRFFSTRPQTRPSFHTLGLSKFFPSLSVALCGSELQECTAPITQAASCSPSAPCLGTCRPNLSCSCQKPCPKAYAEILPRPFAANEALLVFSNATGRGFLCCCYSVPLSVSSAPLVCLCRSTVPPPSSQGSSATRARTHTPQSMCRKFPSTTELGLCNSW